MQHQFDVVIERDEEGYYIASVPQLPACHTQARSLDEVMRVTGLDLVAALAKAGFAVIRIRGRHHFLRHPDGRKTVVPLHSGETIGPGLLHKILRDCQLNSEDLQRFP